MTACAALLILALAGPALAVPPLSPAADNDAINDEITAGDPTFTTPPAPLERLLAAAELAEGRLRAAASDDAATDLLTLTVAARNAAYLRTGEAVHVCRSIAAAEHVLARKDLSPGLSTTATDFRKEALASLGARVCEEPPREQAAKSAIEAEKGPARAVAPVRPVEPAAVDHIDRRHVRAGVGTLVPGLLLFAPMAGLLAYRGAGREEVAGINADTKLRPATEAETARAAALADRYTATTAGAVALGVTGAALVVTGAVLLATGRRVNRVALAPWGGREVGGLVFQGRF